MEAHIIGFQFLKELYKGEDTFLPIWKMKGHGSQGPYIA